MKEDEVPDFPEESDPEVRELATRLFFDFGLLNRGPIKKVEGATRGEMAMLGFIYAKKRGVSPSELSENLNVTTARVANTLKTLEKKGYVTRQLDESDRRRIVVNITPAGTEFFVRTHREGINGLCALVRELGEEDSREFIRIAGRMITLMAEKDGRDVPEFPGVV